MIAHSTKMVTVAISLVENKRGVILHKTKMVALDIFRRKQEGCDSTLVAMEISRGKQEGCDSTLNKNGGYGNFSWKTRGV